MAIPTSLFATKYGVAVMRYDHSLSEWFFEAWVAKRTIVLDLSAGTHTFQLWLILGGNVGGVMSLGHDGWTRITAVKMRK